MPEVKLAKLVLLIAFFIGFSGTLPISQNQTELVLENRFGPVLKNQTEHVLQNQQQSSVDIDNGEQNVDKSTNLFKVEPPVQMNKIEILKTGFFNEEDLQFYKRFHKQLNLIGQQTLHGELLADSPDTWPEDVTEESHAEHLDARQEHVHVIDEDSNASFPLFEGDMLLSKKQMKQILRDAKNSFIASQPTSAMDRIAVTIDKRKITSQLSDRWQMPIHFNYDQQTGVDVRSIQAALKLWSDDTCVSFLFDPNPNSGTDYIRFVKADGCWSAVGRNGGEQKSSIGEGCTKLGIVAHEIGHNLGFFHEQARPDRDANVNIKSELLQSGTEGNFVERSYAEVLLYGIPYDYGSVMHYDPTAFARAPDQFTIVALDKLFQNTMGQRETLAFSDVRFINTAYCSDVCRRKLNCMHFGYTDPKNCSQCRCPDGFDGILCEKPRETGYSSCGNSQLVADNTWQTITISDLANCNWLIQASLANAVVELQIKLLSFPCQTTCAVEFLEVKFLADFGRTGARLCCNKPVNSIVSATNKLMLLYRGQNGDSVSLRFRQKSLPPTTLQAQPPVLSTTSSPTLEPKSESLPKSEPETSTTLPETLVTGKPSPKSQTTTQATTFPGPEEPGSEGPESGPDLQWSQWGQWGPCSASCGACGLSTRTRTCASGNNDCGSGDVAEVKRCGFGLCPTTRSLSACATFKKVLAVCENGQLCIRKQLNPCNNRLRRAAKLENPAFDNSQSFSCCAPYTVDINGSTNCVLRSQNDLEPPAPVPEMVPVPDVALTPDVPLRLVSDVVPSPDVAPIPDVIPDVAQVPVPEVAPVLDVATALDPNAVPVRGFPFVWSHWSPWGQCSATCGGCGTQRRWRRCIKGKCLGEVQEFRNCNFNPCFDCIDNSTLTASPPSLENSTPPEPPLHQQDQQFLQHYPARNSPTISTSRIKNSQSQIADRIVVASPMSCVCCRPNFLVHGICQPPAEPKKEAVKTG